MKEHEAFLRQARSDYKVYQHLWGEDRNKIATCHPLHYLQMACEKLAKAVLMATADRDLDRYSHAAFSDLPPLLRRSDVASKLDHKNFRIFKDFLRRSASIFHSIDELHPSVGPGQPGGGPNDGPNTEYPWRSPDGKGGQIWKAPVDHSFRLVSQLQSGDGAAVVDLIEGLLDRFEAIFP